MLREIVKQLASTSSAAIAAACCLGASWALSALSAIGAGFLVNDAILIPLYALFLVLSVWLLYRSVRAHADRRPLRLGAAGALVALAGLFVASIVIYTGIALLVAASAWDFVNGQRQVRWQE